MSKTSRAPVTLLHLILTYAFVILVYVLVYYEFTNTPPEDRVGPFGATITMGYYVMPFVVAYCTVAYPIIYFRQIRPRNKEK